MEKITLGIPNHVASDLRNIAADRGLSLAATVRAVLLQYTEDRAENRVEISDPFSRTDLKNRPRSVQGRRRMDAATRDRIYGKNQFLIGVDDDD